MICIFLSFYLETISNLPKLAKIKTIQRMPIYPLTFYSIGYISTHVHTHTNTATAKSRQSCLTVRSHRRQPTRLPCPWDSPGKNTRVGCHFLLQCRKVKSESEVAQSCPTLSDPLDCSLPGASVHGIFQAYKHTPKQKNFSEPFEEKLHPL